MTTTAPVIRALLLTDLCESVRMVEQIGDQAAAALFQAHDMLVLKLQQRWSGQLIDRSDGMLLLFERPLHAVGFALDYQAELDALGAARGLLLRARAGLHVGEVHVWRNPAEAVQAGAKPVEVEGLAKPMAARLMAMAGPGQVLVSAVTEALARRATQDELGRLRDRLVWKSHGAWFLKGIPAAQEVFEVGEIGTAPMLRPRSSAKAWRAVPLWRRPGALALQLVLAIGVLGGAWYATRSEPAIAFAQRDWVVLGDLRNTTGNLLLDDSLEEAFRISLEQSRYVNVLSDLKVQMTLQRISRQAAGSALDRALASEVALRDGASLVMLPTIAEVGGRLRFSVEVVDPQSRQTLAVEHADARNVEQTLAMVDRVTRRLRGRLGEVASEVAGNSTPLPDVTTSSLDGLRAYALGKSAFVRGKFDQAYGHYRQAAEIDPDFALAHWGVVTALNALDRLEEAGPHIDKARSLRERLPVREQLYLDAWMVQLENVDGIYPAWSQLSDLYPDYTHAAVNTAFALESGNRWQDVPRYARRASGSQSEAVAIAHESEGRAELAMGEYAAAMRAFQLASDNGLVSASVWLGNVHAAQDEWDKAQALWPDPAQLGVAYYDRVSVLLDQGEPEQALATAIALLARTPEGSSRKRQGQLMLAVAQHAAGQTRAARATLRQALIVSAGVLAEGGPMKHRYPEAVLVANAGLLGQRLGEPALLARAISVLDKHPELLAQTGIAQWKALLHARRRAAQGEPEAAARALAGSLDGHEFFQTRVTLADLWQAAGDREQARAAQRWLADHRGQAYAEYANCGWCTQALNVHDSRQARLQLAGPAPQAP